MEFSSESEESEMEKSDIDDEESDSETEDEQFNWGEETDQYFSHQDPINPPLPVLKWDSSREKNLRGVWGVGTKRTQRRKEKLLRQLGQLDLCLYKEIHKKKELMVRILQLEMR